jgi:[acyl-carrier-protein] S-malonyltransferase
VTQAMIFPGQGSQSVGMLGVLAEDAATQALCAQASDVLGYDVFELMQSDSQNRLNQTAFTQPALLVASVAFYQHWLRCGGQSPIAMAGHSLGEWSALVCAGAVSFSDALRLVQKRGEYMQSAGDQRPGAMAAILGLADEQVAELCALVANGEVAPANYNSPGQVVVSGDVSAVDEVVSKAKPAGAKLAKKLAVSVASHSALMAPAAVEFSALLEAVEFATPSIPVFHNYDVRSHSDSAALREVLVAQLVSPVRWVECVAKLSEYGVNQAIECGPGKVLTGLAKRMKPALATQTITAALSTLGEA